MAALLGAQTRMRGRGARPSANVSDTSWRPVKHMVTTAAAAAVAQAIMTAVLGQVNPHHHTCTNIWNIWNIWTKTSLQA
jgi:hypothetical protein